MKEIIEQIETKLKSYIGNRKAIIGISGGLDSAVVACLCVKALGKENVIGISMPYGTQDTSDANLVIKHLGIEYKEINIKTLVDNFNFLNMDKISKGNIMARVRMTILYVFANELKGMVVGTSNKSELEIGYFTKYGDGGVDLEPIGNLLKTEIFELAKKLGIPEKIINKKPSAGFYEGQTDEKEIGLTYREIDNVIKGGITSGPIFARVMQLRKANEHKLKMPPIFEVGG